jgi:hypothetical protein
LPRAAGGGGGVSECSPAAKLKAMWRRLVGEDGWRGWALVGRW